MPAAANPPASRLLHGDNLDVLRRRTASDSVDLCDIDPPLNSRRNDFQIDNNPGEKDRAQEGATRPTPAWRGSVISSGFRPASSPRGPSR